MGLLDDRGVVITGAGRGLGRAFAIAVAAEGAGVVVNDIDVDEAQAVVDEITEAGGRAIASGASVAAWDTAGSIVEDCVREFGRIDGLVNNAVAYSYYGAPWDEQAEQIRQQVEVNIMGSLFCGVHAMRHMREQRRGSIVNLTSRAMMGVPGLCTYAVCKGATASATYGWAIEMMPFGVRVNALAPGARTRAVDLAGEYASYATADIGPPELVAPAVVFLLSDLSDGITGQTVLSRGRQLGLVAPPQTMQPVEERDAWTAPEIADAFDRIYRERLFPLGPVATEYAWAPDDHAPV
jgi:NAD(P)-dependent dehydrogenase (short-subunit alcohol dehydrogenase family)